MKILSNESHFMMIESTSSLNYPEKNNSIGMSVIRRRNL